MKMAFIFPPQWDPRQPPLSIPSIVGALRKTQKALQIRAWDLNLRLYIKTIFQQPESIVLLRKYLAKEALESPVSYKSLESELESYIYSSFLTLSKGDSLFLDRYSTSFSPYKSQDWLTILNEPHQLFSLSLLQESIKEIVQWKPDIVAFSTLSDTQVINTLAIASVLKSKLPRSQFIAGGSPFTERQSLLPSVGFLFDTFDYVCVGDGEPTLEALCRNGSSIIPNVMWRDGSTVVRNSTVPSSFSEKHAADFSVLDLNNYLTPTLVLPIETSRNCYWGKCLFCNHPKGKKTHPPGYARSIKSTVDEMQFHAKHGINNFFIIDEAISANRMSKLSLEILKRELVINWLAYCRLEKDLSQSNIKLARRAGLRKLFFGLETGSNRLLRKLRKGTTRKSSIEAILNASAAGLPVHLFMIGGFPTETKQDHEETLSLLEAVLPHVDPFGFTYNFFPLTCGINTAPFKEPNLIGANKIISSSSLDLSTRFHFSPSYSANRETFVSKRYAIRSLILNSMRNTPVLTNCNFTNDSTHLLAIISNEAN